MLCGPDVLPGCIAMLSLDMLGFNVLGSDAWRSRCLHMRQFATSVSIRLGVRPGRTDISLTSAVADTAPRGSSYDVQEPSRTYKEQTHQKQHAPRRRRRDRPVRVAVYPHDF